MLKMKTKLCRRFVYVLYMNCSLFCVSPQHRATFSPAGSYAVDGLKPDTLYMFSLAARSDMGLGVFTQAIEARTAQSSKCCHLISPSFSQVSVTQYLFPLDMFNLLKLWLILPKGMHGV